VVSGYTAIWERRPSFNDSGSRRRSVASLGEAQLIMQMAFMAEPGFRAGSIIDSFGHTFGFVLTDPMLSEQDYLDRDFEHHEEWRLQPDGNHLV
jgi:hypothetical protein